MPWDRANTQWIIFLLISMGHCFLAVCQLYKLHYIEKKETWTEAQQYCREKHTDLVTVTNMTNMERLLSSMKKGKDGAWIGLFYQTDGTRTWYWSLPGVELNESEITWNEGEPNDNDTENCGFLRNDLKMGDVSCKGEYKDTSYFVCFDESKQNKKFQVIKEKKTWLKAQSYCRDQHTDLVSGTNQLKDPQLEKEIKSVNTFMFVGLFRDAWRWSDGSSFSFRHWHEEFDDEQENDGQCAMTVFDDEGRWETDSCNEEKPFICYDDKVILIKEAMNWEDALYYCRDHHHDLVTITNMDDQRWIQEKVKEASTDYVWMGLRYTCTLDFWFWVSDDVVSYENWALDGPMDDCDMSGAMETGGEHKWFNMKDDEEFNFICSTS